MLMKELEMDYCADHKDTCSKQAEHENRLTRIEGRVEFMEKNIQRLEKLPEDISGLKATLHTWCMILAGLMTAVIFIFRAGPK